MIEKISRTAYLPAASAFRVPLFFFLSLFFAVVNAGEPVDRDAFIKAFIEKADIVRSFDEKILSAEADVSRAKWQYFPKLKLTFGMAPFPKYTYVPADPDSTVPREQRGYWDTSQYLGDLGVALEAKGEITIPIYTFGKIGNAQEAAEKGVEVKKAEKDAALLALRKEAASFYYAYVMATDMRNILELSLEKITDAETKLDQWLYEGKEGVSQNDLIKLRIEKERLLYGIDNVAATLDTLRTLFEKVLGPGYALKDEFMYKAAFDTPLAVLEKQLLGPSAYSRLMTNGLGALESLYELEKSNFYPNFGAVGDYRIDYTSSVHDDKYPLPNSPYNGYGGEAGVGLEFNLNILEQVAKMRKAKAEWKAMEYKISFAKETALIDLRRRYNELKALDSRVEHTRKAHKLAKGWMTTEFMNYEAGMFTTRDLIDSVKAFVENEYQLISALYDYNMKIEDLITFAGVE